MNTAKITLLEPVHRLFPTDRLIRSGVNFYRTLVLYGGQAASADGTKYPWNELAIRQRGVGCQEIKSTDDYRFKSCIL